MICYTMLAAFSSVKPLPVCCESAVWLPFVGIFLCSDVFMTIAIPRGAHSGSTGLSISTNGPHKVFLVLLDVHIRYGLISYERLVRSLQPSGHSLTFSNDITVREKLEKRYMDWR